MKIKTFTTLLVLLACCGSAKAEEIKVLTQNIWGVPDSVSVRTGGPSIQTRKVQFCNRLKSLPESPDIVMVQEVWNIDDALYMIKNCGYSYSSYQDGEHFNTILNSSSQKLTSNFFEAVKQQIDDALSYFGTNIDDLLTGAVCLSYTSGVCNMLEEVGIIPDRSKLLQATSWFKDSYVKSGLLILSKRPIVSQYRMIYSSRGDLDKLLNDLERSVTKSLLLVKVALPNGSYLWVANTHLISDHEYKPNERDHYSTQRITQFAEALSFIKNMVGTEPVIFGGDFNMGDTYPCWDTVKSVFVRSGIQGDLDEQATYDGRYNKYANGNEGKLDHILGINGVTAEEESLAFVNNPVSDHYGIFKTFSVPTN
ncbi:MAG: endonuclease/exonuclease/phosphatase family protein [bacterium]